VREAFTQTEGAVKALVGVCLISVVALKAGEVQAGKPGLVTIRVSVLTPGVFQLRT
jgi:hypothetical protein